MERQEPCPSAARLDDTPQLAKVTRGPPGAGCRVRLASQSRPPRKPPTGRSTTRSGSMGSSLGRAVSAALGFSRRVRFRKCRSVLKSGMLPTGSAPKIPMNPSARLVLKRQEFHLDRLVSSVPMRITVSWPSTAIPSASLATFTRAFTRMALSRAAAPVTDARHL